MTPAECTSALQENLELCLQYARDLEEILRHEREALEQRDPTQITETAHSKQVCVEKLAELGRSRNVISRTNGFDENDSSIPKLIDWSGGALLLTKTWLQFLDLARSCNQLNATNGAAIRIRQSQIDDAIGLLRYGSVGTKTYGPTGQKAGEPRTRSLAEA